MAAPTTELITNPLRFPGQYEDQESGLYQNFHRDYDPRIGAYGTQDPFGVFQTGANRYGYVYGNPVHLVDPRGLSPDEDHDGIPDSLEIPHVDLLDPTRDNRDIDHDGRPDLPGVPLLGGAAPGRGGGVGGLKAPVPPSVPPAIPRAGCNQSCSANLLERVPGSTFLSNSILDHALAAKAPRYVVPGIKKLEGVYLRGNRLEPWTAYYDDYGRLIARTDYNAGNIVEGIPNIHCHEYIYGPGYQSGKEVVKHATGEFTPKR